MSNFTAPAPVSVSPPAAAAVEAKPAAASTQRVRVLIMDDEPDIRDLMETMLNLLGYDVGTARNGEEALAAHEKATLDGQPFDIVVMDLTIPNGMGGAETIKRLRQKDNVIRAVVASGYSDDPIMARHKQHGFDTILPKPYVLNDLMRVLGQLTGPRAA
jgi:CheY-like chemotaxis protein